MTPSASPRREHAPPKSARNPFAPDHRAAYLSWRDDRLERCPKDVSDLVVPIGNALAPTTGERQRIASLCGRANMAVYQLDPESEAGGEVILSLARAFGFRRFDRNLHADEAAVSALEVRGKQWAGEYIPYTDRRLRWHTDGYYNEDRVAIRGFLLHCSRPANAGGENGLLDPEIAYILLRDENPDYIRALMAPDAFTIPANTRGETEIRAAYTGPVFSIRPNDGSLLMRYTERQRYVHWKQDTTTLAAVRYLAEILSSDIPYIFRYRLSPGQGLVCNNVLHYRTAFTDAPGSEASRLMLRVRSYERVRAPGGRQETG
ncbi:MAG: TauD/TfdA family dioxygenase [Gammaproteobacteria bacterium]|jgi:hypothetical protein|nr:TauD/TfdA family dioxygenase [Gammaproteobacteria bacterium]